MTVDIKQLNEINALLDSGDRGGAYYRYYELTGSLQALIQAQITTYSGAWGGLAMVGNYFAKLANQDVYDLTLDKFSYDIDKRLFDEVALEISQGRDGVILDTRIQELDHAVWNDKGMGSFFPGNMQFLTSIYGWANHWSEIFSTGTGTALNLGWLSGIAGLDIFSAESYGPAELGSRLDEFSGPAYNTIGVDHSEFDGRTIRVYDNATGFLVFIQDTQTSGSTGFESTETVSDALDPSSNAYAARQALRNYLQAFTPYPMAHDVPPIPNQIPPNIFFEQHELDNGITPESLTLWHQEVLNKFVQLDVNSEFDFGAREGLISQFSNVKNQGIEGFLNAMEGLFFGSGTSSVTSDESYDSRMQSLASHIDSAIDAGATFNLIPTNELDIINLVQSDLTSFGNLVRFSVLSGAPFVLEAAGYSGGVFSGSIAEYDAATYSDEFWVDRVDFFDLLIHRNSENLENNTGHLSIDNVTRVGTGEHYYESHSDSGETTIIVGDDVIDLPGGQNIVDQVIFGSNNSETDISILEGGHKNDRIYGMGGDDHLTGAGGNDLLEGGKGNDTYYFNNGEGHDVIIDISGTNKLVINGNEITKVSQEYFNGIERFHLDDFGNKYLLEPTGDVLVWVNGYHNGTITIKSMYNDFARFGITLGNNAGTNLIPNEVYSGVSKNVSKLFLNALGYFSYGDPLVLDLNGDGKIFTTHGGNGSTLFDFNGDGVKTGTGWIKSSEGILVLDKDANGTIDNGNELFGDYTVKFDGSLAINGFDALSDYDSNGDGLVDARDSQFGNLRIWSDTNQDAISQLTEIFTLSELNIESIGVSYTPDYGSDDWENISIAEGTYTKSTITGLESHFVRSLNLLEHKFFSEFTDEIAIPEHLAGLPDAEGSGAVRNLLEAAVLNPSLESTLTQFSNGSTHSEQTILIDQLLQEWADSSDFITLDQRISNMTVAGNDVEFRFYKDLGAQDGDLANILNDTYDGAELKVGGLEYDQSLDILAKIRVLEVFNNQSLLDVEFDTAQNGSSYSFTSHVGKMFQSLSSEALDSVIYITDKDFFLPGEFQSIITDAYKSLQDTVYKKLIGQTRLLSYKAALTPKVDEDGGVLFDFTSLEAFITNRSATDKLNTVIDVLELLSAEGKYLVENGWSSAHVFVSGLIGELSTEERHELTKIFDDANTHFEDYGLITFASNVESEGIVGNSGHVDIYYGSDQSDSVSTQGGDDLISGGKGDDYLSGGRGSDTYIFNLGDGQDEIYEHQELAMGEFVDFDTIIFGDGIALSDLAYERSAKDLIIYVGSNDDQIRVIDYYQTHAGYSAVEGPYGYRSWGPERIEQVSVGGNLYLLSDVIAQAPYVAVTSPYGGTNESNLFIVRNGSGAINGKEGSNVVIFGPEVGDYKLYYHLSERGDQDVIQFLEGVNPSDIVVSASSASLLLTNQNTGSVLTIENYFYIQTSQGQKSFGGFLGDNPVGYSVIRVEFADGTFWTEADFSALHLVATEGDDILHGSSENDVINALGGNDVIYGAHGNDTLTAGSGNNLLYGNDGDDILRSESGEGNHSILSGGNGNDTYLYGLSDGNLTIVNENSEQSDYDKIEFIDGILQSDVQITQQGEGLYIEIISTGSSIIVRDFYKGHSFELGEIKFADGSTLLRDELIKLTWNPSSGSTPIYGTRTNDVITNIAGSRQILGRDGNDILIGGDDDDNIQGGNGDDILVGGAGSDVMYGGRGHNVYRFGHGQGNALVYYDENSHEHYDVLEFFAGISAEDLSVRRFSDHLQLSIVSSAETVTIYGFFDDAVHSIDAIEFADGSSLDFEMIEILVLQASDEGDYFIGGNLTNNFDGLAGNDEIHGGSRNDVLAGSGGSDDLFGHNGNDVLRGGVDNDRLEGGEGNDVMDGGLGNDYLFGGAGSDTYIYRLGDGNDVINNRDDSQASYDALRFEEGILPTDVLIRRRHGDLILDIQSTSESITVQNFFVAQRWAYLDLFMLGEVRFSAINGTFIGVFDQVTGEPIDLGDIDIDTNGDLRRSIPEDNYLDIIEFSDGTVWTTEVVLEIASQGSSGDDVIIGTDGSDFIDGFAGNDSLYGGHGNDVLTGGEGDDSLYGGAGDDILRGSHGNDYLTGYSGHDVYLIGLGDGQTTIQNQDVDQSGFDVIRFMEGISPEDILVRRNAKSLELKVVASGETVTVESFFTQAESSRVAYQIDLVEFTDGTQWNINDLKQMVLLGTTGDDFLYAPLTGDANLNGLEGDDFIYGEAGNDVLLGGEGNDQLIGEDGNDTLNGNEGEDYLNGGSGDDQLEGGEGNDYLSGSYGNDALLGGNGDDTIYAGDGNDSLSGGAGTNSLIGQDGNDTYVVGLNNDMTTITDASGANVLLWSDGIAEGDIIARRVSSYQLELTFIPTGGIIKIDNYFSGFSLGGAADNMTIVFESGVEWDSELIKTLVTQGTEASDSLNGFNDSDSILNGFGGNDLLIGGEGNNTLNGGVGDDSLRGGLGDDVYIYRIGDGNDIIDQFGNSDGFDVLSFSEGISIEDVKIFSKGDDLKITIIPTMETITVIRYFSHDLYKIQQINFYDGLTLNQEDILVQMMEGTSLNEILTGTAKGDTLNGLGGNDTLNGLGGNDTLAGGIGDDNLQGGVGDDTYLYGLGDGNDSIITDSTNTADNDKLIFDSSIQIESTSVERNGDDLLLQVDGGASTITVQGYFSSQSSEMRSIEFSDGTSWSRDTVNGFVRQDTTPMSLSGNGNSNFLEGAAGDDYLDGRGEADTLYGYDGADTLIGGGGNDAIYGGDGADILKSGSGDDHIYAGEGNDLSINGSTGNDTYYFGLGDGNNSINNNDSGASSTDKIVFLSGVLPEAVSVGKSGNHLIFNLTQTSEMLTVLNYYKDSKSKIDLVEFADGVVWDSSQIEQQVLLGTIGEDVLTGTGGDDVVTGQNGDDTLNGGYGNDRLTGGLGNDLLIGGAGNDTYLYEIGDGDDVISSLNNTLSDKDSLAFGDGLLATNTFLEKVGGDLVISFSEQVGSITIQSHFIESQFEMNSITFADGQIWDAAYIAGNASSSDEPLDLVGTGSSDVLQGAGGDDSLNAKGGNDTLYGEGGNDSLVGGGGKDALYGGKGNDIIKGGNGADHFYGGQGDDTHTGGKGSDTYHFSEGDGYDKINNASNNFASETDVLVLEDIVSEEDIWFTKTNNHLDVYLLDSDDHIRVNNWYLADKYELDRIDTGSSSIDAAGIEQLVSAMAGFDAPIDGSITLTTEERNQIDASIAVAWQ